MASFRLAMFGPQKPHQSRPNGFLLLMTTKTSAKMPFGGKQIPREMPTIDQISTIPFLKQIAD